MTKEELKEQRNRVARAKVAMDVFEKDMELYIEHINLIAYNYSDEEIKNIHPSNIRLLASYVSLIIGHRKLDLKMQEIENMPLEG